MAVTSQQLRDIFGNAVADSVLEEGLNPLRFAERKEFDRNTRDLRRNEPICYRERAIAFVCNKKLPFSSTLNSSFDVFRQFVKVTCPYCKKEMNTGNSGSNFSTTSQSYHCECGAKVNLNFPSEYGFNAAP